MIKQTILYILCAMLLASCEFRHIMSEEEYNNMNKATLEFDIDWSELDEKPSGATLVFFPCDEHPVNPQIHTIHTNKVDKVTVSLPDQDYSVICFNQSETEFAALKFGLESFEDAFVQIKSDEEMGNYSTKYDWTRGFSAQTAIKPQSFASSSLTSIKKLTRGFSAQTAIKPQSSIKSLSLSVSVFGINKSVLLKSRLKNLSSGIKLGTKKLLTETVDQEIATDSWKMDLSKDEKTASILTTSFGTFGIDPALYKTKATRALTEEEPVGERVILALDFFMPDGTVYNIEIDVTDQLLRQLLDMETNGSKRDLRIIIGNKYDPEGSNNAPEDYITSLGSINLHKTFEGMGVYINKWGDPIVMDIDLSSK